MKYKKFEMQPYLLPGRIDSNLARFIFQVRSSMIDLKGNFRHKYNDDINCMSCLRPEPEVQSHLFTCDVLSTLDIQQSGNTVTYTDLFSDDLEKQIQVTVILKERLKLREKIVKQRQQTLLKRGLVSQ